MRIVLVADDYYPQLGGVPEHVHHLALELNARGHEATVVTANMRHTKPDAPFVRRVGTSIVIYANGGVARITAGLGLTDRLTELFKALRADVVHVHGGLQPTFGLVAPQAAARAGIPVVATFHTSFPRSIGYRLFQKPLQKILDLHAATIAVSSAAVTAMSRYFKANWEIIPNGVDLGIFKQNDRRSASDADRPRLLFLGRLEPRNGLHTLLSALPRITKRFPLTELMAAGDGPWRTTYRKQAFKAGLPVRFLGRVFSERPFLYQQADLYLCPTSRASFGVTLLEAMACGTPMVVSDIPAFREVAGEQASFVPPAEPEAWAETVVSLLEDPDRREAMSEAGRVAVESYDWREIADRILAVYQRVT